MSTSGGNSGGPNFATLGATLGAAIGAGVRFFNTVIPVENIPADLVGQAQFTIAAPPCGPVAPGGEVCEVDSTFVSNIDTTPDSYSLTGTLWVSSADSSQVVQVVASVVAPQVGPDQSASIDWTTGVLTAIEGADLTFDNAAVTVNSAAGGTFWAVLQISGGYS